MVTLTSEIMLPLVISSFNMLVEILSGNVAELLCTCVGFSIVGVRLRLWREKRNFNLSEVGS